MNISRAVVDDQQLPKDGDKERKNEDVRYRRSARDDSDISDVDRNYLLRNDRYLLFNDFDGVESSKLGSRAKRQGDKLVYR